jgi:hypothetical protein
VSVGTLANTSADDACHASECRNQFDRQLRWLMSLQMIMKSNSRSEGMRGEAEHFIGECRIIGQHRSHDVDRLKPWLKLLAFYQPLTRKRFLAKSGLFDECRPSAST